MFSFPSIPAALCLCLTLGMGFGAAAQTTLDVRAVQQGAWVDVVVHAKSTEHDLSRRNIIFPEFEPQWRQSQVSERRSSGRSTFSISIGPGRAPTVNQGGESSITLQMRLQPRRAGELTLGAFQLQVGGQVMDESSPQVFNFASRATQGSGAYATGQTGSQPNAATGGSLGSPQGSSPRSDGNIGQPGSTSPVPEKAVFYRWKLEGIGPDRSVYAGQKVFATLYRYEHPDYYIDGCLEPERLMPDFKGIFKEQADLKGRRHGAERVGQLRYQTTVMGSYALYPYKKGRLDLPVVSDECQVLSPERKYQIRRQRRRPRRGDLVPYTAGTEERHIVVKALPKPPKDYVATVIGRPIVSGRLERKRIKGGESVRLVTRLRMPSSGGRLADVPELELPDSPDYESFPSPAQCRGPQSATGQTRCDERVKTWLIRPTKAGQIKIKGPTLVYFDPAKRAYKRRSIRKLSVEVTSPPPQERTSGQDTIGQDEGPQLQGIRDVTDVEATHGAQGYSALVQIALFGAPLFFLGLLGYERIARRRDRTAGSRSARSAARKAQKRLLGLDMAQPAQELSAEIHGAATQYLDDRFQVTTRGKTYAQLKTVLADHRVGNELADAFVNELETLDFARFTGMSHERNAAESVRLMSDYIRQIEEVVS